MYLFSLLNCKDTQVIQVVLDGLNNLLKVAGPDVSCLLLCLAIIFLNLNFSGGTCRCYG